MSDTPRTEERIVIHEYCEWVGANFARGLERELNAAQAMIRQHQLLDEENQRLKERVKRLEKAGDRMAAAWSEEWLTQAEAESIIDGWHGAKEAA